MVSVKHAKVVGTPDSNDGKVSSNAWNDSHVITGSANVLLGTDNLGAAQEVTVGSGLTYTGGTLSGAGGTLSNALTVNNSGTGAASGTTFDGSAPVTISWNTTGAQVAGSYLTANQTIALSGDASGSGTTAITVAIGANKVTRGMLAAASGATILGATAAGNVADLTAAQAKTFLAIANTDVSGLGTASTVNTGTSGHTVPFLDGGNTYSGVTTVSGDVRTTSTNLFRLENGNLGVPAAATGTGLEIAGNATNGGTIFQALDRPFTTHKPIYIDCSAISLRPSGTAALVVSSTGAVLTGTLTVGSTVSLDSSGLLTAAASPAFTGDVTKASGSLATVVAANAVTYAKFQQVAASSLVGNATGSLANATGITLAADHAFSGTSLQLGAFTGEVSKSAGALATTVLAAATATGSILTTGSGGIGYRTGAGGAVTQLTSKSTGVTLSKICGQITTINSALASATGVSFTVTNTLIAATDTIDLVLASGNATAGTYNYQIDKVSAGSFVIWFKNISAGSLSEALVFNFSIKKAVAA